MKQASGVDKAALNTDTKLVQGALEVQLQQFFYDMVLPRLQAQQVRAM